MKKILMAFACFALASMTATAQLAQITLMHDGQATMFNSDKLSDALNAATDGDVIYFNEGSYTGGVTINKRVSLVGVGEGTVLNGDITINLEESAAAMPANMLDALQLTGSVNVNSNTDGLKLRKCKFVNFKPNANRTMSNCTLDRCFITGTLSLHNKIESITVIDSKLKYVQGQAATASGATLLNCNIYTISNNSSGTRLLATLINCIIHDASSGNSTYMHKDCMFINCLIRNNSSLIELLNFGASTNCWTAPNAYLDATTIECQLNDDALQEQGYLGTDGTVVGITGGTAPFTLVPSAPRITESVIKVDPETKTLNVNLKVTAN